jgi:hypothetical protein
VKTGNPSACATVNWNVCKSVTGRSGTAQGKFRQETFDQGQCSARHPERTNRGK